MLCVFLLLCSRSRYLPLSCPLACPVRMCRLVRPLCAFTVDIYLPRFHRYPRTRLPVGGRVRPCLYLATACLLPLPFLVFRLTFSSPYSNAEPRRLGLASSIICQARARPPVPPTPVPLHLPPSSLSSAPLALRMPSAPRPLPVRVP
ncbi:hypothetical protein BV20DRAFT_328971 [Pilatotrama ljubarskyi]|nr:hypothetical protein BV20DRAFT_328971 [Pilatotrama ljubarskyi]